MILLAEYITWGFEFDKKVIGVCTRKWSALLCTDEKELIRWRVEEIVIEKNFPQVKSFNNASVKSIYNEKGNSIYNIRKFIDYRVSGILANGKKTI